MNHDEVLHFADLNHLEWCRELAHWTAAAELSEHEGLLLAAPATLSPAFNCAMRTACGKPITERTGGHVTDDEVCSTTDGPGFLLCCRARCERQRTALGVDGPDPCSPRGGRGTRRRREAIDARRAVAVTS